MASVDKAAPIDELEGRDKLDKISSLFDNQIYRLMPTLLSQPFATAQLYLVRAVPRGDAKSAAACATQKIKNSGVELSRLFKLRKMAAFV